MRIRLLIAYDGTPFAGWQSQAGGRTVQDVLEKAIEHVAHTKIRLHGAGRTDAGVHALGQVAHFDAPEKSRMQPTDWRRALNSMLPPAIRILRAIRSPSNFHARFSAKEKIYRYDLWIGDVLPPHLAHRAWHIPRELDLAALRSTLHLFVGQHDFRPFSANRGKPTADTVRCIKTIRISQAGSILRLSFHGNGFLYKMVRMLTGAGVRVASGREDLSSIQDLLLAPNSGRWTYVAPADGLYLMHVRY